MILTSLNPISSSQQQQEALPDETEVVEEMVAEVSEVGGWWPQVPSPSLTTSSTWENQTGTVGLTLEQDICPFPTCTQTDINPTYPPILDTLLNASQTFNGTLYLEAIKLCKVLVFKLWDHFS